MIRFFLFAILALTLIGCATSKTHWVDDKGRDCIRTTVRIPGFALVSEKDDCAENAGPLAIQPYKVDAQVTQKSQ